MEEILASIRRIISEDEAPAEAEEAPAPAVVEEPVMEAAANYDEPVAVYEEPEEDEVLELTDRVDGVETHGDLDVYPVDEPVAKPADEEPIMSKAPSETAASAFGQLARTLQMPKDARTLEDVVRELLRPLLKAWLDEHLPEIVKAKVEAEVERIARGRSR